MNRRVPVGIVAVVALGLLGYSSFRSLERAAAVEASCEATDPALALELGAGLVEGLDPSDPLLPLAVECRCGAFVSSGRATECAGLVGATLDRAGGDWVDGQALDRIGLHLAAAGQPEVTDRFYTAAARTVAMTAPRLGHWALALSALGDPSRLTGAFLPALRALPEAESTSLRIDLARRIGESGGTAEALALLEPPPPTTSPSRDAWHRARAEIVARGGDVAELSRGLADWERAGGDPRYIGLVYASELSRRHLFDNERSPAELLRTTLAAAPDDIPRVDLEGAYLRLLFEAAAESGPGVVPAIAEEARARGVVLDDALISQFAVTDVAPATGLTAELRLPGSAAGGSVTVLVHGDHADEAGRTLPIPPDGVVRIPVTSAAHPTRWVVSTAAGARLVSGTTGAATSAPIADRAPVPFAAPADLTRAPADGHRRLFVVIGDCMDWHLVRYLQARGELPTLRAMEPLSLSGVVHSEPAFTGAAMEKLAHPRVVNQVTVADYVHSLGVELQGLEAVGVNPFAGLRWVLPESPYLADVVGAGPRRALNLLFSHGNIDAGRHAEIVGPNLARTPLDLAHTRSLTAEELAAMADATPPDDVPRAFLEEMAAEFDAALARVTAKDVDLLLLRVEQTDLLTHRHYGRVVATDTDDGANPLYMAYRYVDLRLGELLRATDGDDVVLFMSDHGIENSLVHSPDAMFIAFGAGEPGRLGTETLIDELPRVFTGLLGVEPDPRWPPSPLAARMLAPEP